MILFISGSNLVKYCLKEKLMHLVPLKPVSYSTSLYISMNPASERIAVIGHKLKPPNYEIDNPNSSFFVAPVVID
jgi:hypothetical protein